MFLRLTTGLLLLAGLAAQQSTLQPDAPIVCSSCDGWNVSREPFKIFGKTYFVGVAGLSSVLVSTSSGLILLDGALPQSAPKIDANIRSLGFRTEDIKLILLTHAHYDHVGGVAALQRVSGARVAASVSTAEAMRRGEPTPDDPQYQSAHSPAFHFPSIHDVKAVNDGERLTVGDVTITAHMTPGHTPGSTTWTWRSCEGARCLDVVYADSLNAVSDDGFRFTGDGTHPSLVDQFKASIALVAKLPCDVMIAVHPGFSNIDEKLAARKKGVTPDPFIDANACRSYAADALKTLEARVASEK